MINGAAAPNARRRGPSYKSLAAVGVFLPYIVIGAALLVIGDSVKGIEHYSSGLFARRHTEIIVSACVAFLCGLGLCAPWIWSRLRNSAGVSKSWLWVRLVGGLLAHSACVYALLLYSYVHIGSVWP